MISLRETLRRVVDVVLVSCFLSATVLAQSGEVSLRGQVTDQSGAVVPGIPVGLIGPGRADMSSVIYLRPRIRFVSA